MLYNYNAMLYILLYYLDVQTRGGKGVIESSKENISQSIYTPKTDGNYKIAPFFGWTPEKEEIANAIRQGRIMVDENFLKIRIERLDSFYSKRWEEEKSYVCERYAIKGRECPNIHPHMNRIYYYYNKWKNENDAWAYAEMITLIEDGERLLGAYIENEQARKFKNVSPAQKADPRPEILNKSIPKDSFRILTDGNGWNTFNIAASGVYEYNPTIVQVGNEDTLISAVNVSQCNVWCATSWTGECAVLFRSVNAGQSWSPLICVVPPSGTPYNVGEVALGADPYRRLFVLAYTSDYYAPDYDIGQITFYANGTVVYSTWVDNSTVSTLTPYVNAEFNWGRSGCAGQPLSGSCTCSASDNWFFIGMNKLNTGLFPDSDGDSLRDGIGVRIWRSTDCGSSWSLVYDGPNRNGSAYDNNQIMLETTNDTRGGNSTPVCSSTGGGDNTIQAVYSWKSPNSCTDPCPDNRIEHLFTDESMTWGNSWTTTTILAGATRPINQPWLSVSRRIDPTTTTSVVFYESQWSSTDGDILGLRASNIPPSGWTGFTLDFSTVDSRTPTVHTDARWQWCPGATASGAGYYHVAFYHKCTSSADPFCNATGYNNTFRVAVLRYNWDLTSRSPEICGALVADTIAIPPPPSYSGGGMWRNWWQLNGTTFRTTSGVGSPWWFGAMWVYCYNAGLDGVCGTSDDVDWDMEWTILSYSCITPVSKDEIKEGKDFIIKGRQIEIYLNNDWEFKVYNTSGRKVFEIKGKGNNKFNLNLPKGAYIYKLNDKLGKFVL